MIITKEIKVIICNSNIKHYESLGYKDLKIWETLIIPVEHLSKGSTIKIKVRCDICGEEKELRYCNYLKNTKNNLVKYACSSKCGLSKKVEICLEKYGVKWSFQSEDIKLKSKLTKKERYSDENYNNMDKNKQTKLKNHGDPNYNNRDQAKETCLSNHGVEWSLQSSEIREKGKITKKEKYGNENFVNPEKAKETLLEKYGDENYRNTEKAKQTNLKIFGVEYSFQSEEVKNKIRKTLIKKYGVEHSMQIPETVQKVIETKTGLSYEDYINQLPDFKKYEREVLKFTRKQPIHLLKNIDKRGNNQYHLDHKFTIIEGFRQNISPYIIGNIVNLEMLPWKDNQTKHSKCSITKEELFKNFEVKNLI